MLRRRFTKTNSRRERNVSSEDRNPQAIWIGNTVAIRPLAPALDTNEVDRPTGAAGYRRDRPEENVDVGTEIRRLR
jgi:hypothetical protein